MSLMQNALHAVIFTKAEVGLFGFNIRIDLTYLLQ